MIDNKVDRDLLQVCGDIAGLVGPDLQAVLLGGSFGRGEGGILMAGEGISVVNDYDLYIKLRDRNPLHFAWLLRRYNQPLLALASDWATRLGIKQLDISLRDSTYFSSQAQPTIEHYELMNGHRVIWGDPSICAGLPTYTVGDIPAMEGVRLLFNRGAGLLIAVKYLLSAQDLATASRGNFFLECNKAVLAMGDLLLLAHGAYHHLYRERMARFGRLGIEILDQLPSLVSEYEAAVRWKLAPDLKKAQALDGNAEHWLHIVDLFQQVWKYYENRRLNMHMEDWVTYSQLPCWRQWIWKRGTTAIFTPVSDPMWNRKIALQHVCLAPVVALLLFAAGERSVQRRDSCLARAAVMLGMFPRAFTLRNWGTLIDEAIRLWHPAGEAGRVIDVSLKDAVRWLDSG